MKFKVCVFAIISSLSGSLSGYCGVGVGNGPAFVSPAKFVVKYAPELTAKPQGDGGVIIDNERLAGEHPELVSKIAFEVKTKAEAREIGVVNGDTLLHYAETHGGSGPLEAVQFEGAIGYASFRTGLEAFDAQYYLLTDQGSLVQSKIHAVPYARGLELIPPVIRTFRVDTTPPEVDLNSVQMSTQSVMAGETLTVSVAASDSGSGMRGDGSDPSWANQNGALAILDPHGKYVDPVTQGTYDRNSGRIVFRHRVNRYAVPGTYRVTHIANVTDNAGNRTEYTEILNLGLSFGVISSHPDTSPPAVDLNGFQISARTVIAGETLTVFVAASDSGSGMRGDGSDPSWANQNGALAILDPHGKYVDPVTQGTYDRNSGRIVFRHRVNRYAVPGTYRVTHIANVTDNAGNRTEYTEILNLGLSFGVISSHPDTSPPAVDLNGFQISARTVIAGETLTVFVAASDSGSGMRGDGSDPSWANQNGSLAILDPSGKYVALGRGEYDRYSGRIVFTLRINRYAIPGTYRITQIGNVVDNAGNETGYTDIPNSGLSFEVIN